MSLIEIQKGGDEPEQRTLSKSQPLSVGTHASNDLCVDEDGVALLHCRISWNKNAFEVVAADSRGVELNGKLVQHSVLRPGDVVRVGSLDITYLGDKGAGARAAQPVAAARAKSDVGLHPITEDSVGVEEDARRSSRDRKQRDSRREDKDRKDRKSRSRRVEEEAIEELEIVEDEPDERRAEVEGALGSRVRRAGRRDEEAAAQPAWKAHLATDRARPGEQDTLRSPLVLTLGFGSAALLLAVGTFFFLNQRTSSSRLYEAATAELDGGRYTEAIALYDQFLKEYPQNSKSVDAALNRARARILSNTEGAAPLWSGGMKTLQDFIDENRDRSNFSDLAPDLVKYGGKIALGAAHSALVQKSEVEKRRETLALSTSALGIVERFAPHDDPPTDLLRQIEEAVRKADASILQQQTFETAVASVEQAIGTSKAMSALESRRNLINQYPEYRTDKKVNDLLARILETEKKLVTSEPFVREAVTAERISLPSKPLTLALAARARTDVASRGRVVVALVQGCCEGIDADTGDPVWRRVIGLDTPFFPLPVAATVPSLLMFDAAHRDLLLVEQDTGKLVWRQPIEEELAGAPLVEEGQVFLPTLGNHIYKLDLVSGRATVRLNFSQKLLAPPALDASKQRMIVAGDRDVFYTLSMRPFECVAVSFTDHQPGSIKAPLLTMGTLLLAAVNNQLETAQLRVFDTKDEKGTIKEIASAKVEGAVRDQPTLRGNQLFVTSSGSRISAFTVSDGQKSGLTVGPTYQGSSPYNGPIYLLAAQDGQLWMVADSLVKLQVSSNAITADPKRSPQGISTQPLQSIGRDLYVGRRAPSGDAVYLVRVAREEMVSLWRTVLGSSVLATMPNPDGSLVILTDDGSVYRLEENELAAGGFKKVPASRLQLPEVPTAPLKASVLASGRIAVVSNEPSQPQLWLINRQGQIERQESLAKPVEVRPIEIDQGIVLPSAGRLSLVSTKEGAAKVEDFVAPVGEGQSSKWTQLARLDDTQFLALNEKGLLGRYQYRPEPVPHLDVAQSVQLEKPVNLPMEIYGGKVVLADTDKRLLVLDAITLDKAATANLDGPALSTPYVSGDRLYVVTAESGLNCFEWGPELKKVWSAPLDKSSLAGRPLPVEGGVVVALIDGRILSLAAADGKIQGQVPLAQPLSNGPERVGNRLVVTSIDGTLYPVEAVLKPVKQ